MTMTYLEGRQPARILETGTFPVEGFGGALVTYGHDEVQEAVRWLVREPILAVDIETEGLGKASWFIKCVTVSTTHHAVIFDPRDEAQFHALRTVINTTDADLIFHNSSFDVTPLVLNRIMDREAIERVRDTLIYARMANPDERGMNSLEACAGTYLGFESGVSVAERARRRGLTKEEWFRTTDIDSPAYRWDAASDGLATARLFPVVRQAAYDRLTTGHPFTKYGVTGEEAWRLVERPQRVNRLFLRRNAKGFRWDPEYLDRYRSDRAVQMGQDRSALEEYGIRPGNSQDLVKTLDRSGLIPEGYPRTKTGQISGSKTHLTMLDHDLVQMFLRLKQWEKSDHDYMSKVADLADINGRVHPSCVILGAQASGRMSYQGLPFHQFDKSARKIILEDEPGDGMCSVDWTQQEPVLAANLAGDTEVLRRYEDESLPDEARDMYRIVGGFANLSRDDSKVTILAQMYGRGLVKLAVELGLISSAEAVAIAALCRKAKPGTGIKGTGIPAEYYWPLEAAELLGIHGLAEANEVKRKVWDVMPKTEMLTKKLKLIAREHKVIFTLSGRILTIPMAWYRDEYGAMTHKGMNYTIQGGAADMLEETVIRCEERGLGDALEIAMHDELVVKREAAHDVSEIMKEAPERLNMIAGRTAKFRTDIADLGDRWGKPE